MHLKGNQEKRCAQWGVGNRWTVRTSEACYGFSLLTLFNICFLEIWGALSYCCDMFIRTQDSLNQAVYEQALSISGFEKAGMISLVKQCLTPR